MALKVLKLVPAIENLRSSPEKPKVQITCIDSCGKNLYIGTEESVLIHYIVEERKNSNNQRQKFFYEKQGHKYLQLKKPIVQIKAASAINRILVLCDNSLFLLNMFDLEPINNVPKMRHVTSFSLNTSPLKGNPFAIEISIATKKKTILVAVVAEDRLQVAREIQCQQTPLSLNMEGCFVCAALTNQYNIYNHVDGSSQDLFPFDLDPFKPQIAKISQDEFLLAAPGALGMFATSSGISQRPPLQWSDALVSIAYAHPYILALNDEFITVHSIIDQQQKQSIKFSGGVCLGVFDGRIFVSTCKEVYALLPVPLDKQVQSLLVEQRVEEAIALADSALKMAKERFTKSMYRNVLQQAGFIELYRLDFDSASDLFVKGHLNPCELICLFPNLLPASSTFTRASPALHDLADVSQLDRGDAARARALKDFLLNYLRDIRDTKLTQDCAAEVDTALLKLLAEVQSPELLSLIGTGSSCDLDDCLPWLRDHGRHHARASLHRARGEHEVALGIWVSIVQEELSDDDFPGLEFLVEYLASLNDHGLVWKHIDWILEKSPELGVRVFTDRPVAEEAPEQLKPEVVVDYLHAYPSAVTIYLEHLVFTRHLQTETFHTQLAVLYLDEAVRLMTSSAAKQEQDQARSRLRQMLQVSKFYRVQLLLGKTRQHNMFPELAILYGKLDEHEKALKLLVHEVKDFGAAFNYCEVNGREAATRRRLHLTLLGVYLDPAASSDQRDAMVAHATALLNDSHVELDTVKVLAMLPESWSVGLVKDFLMRAMRRNLNKSRTARVSRMLARAENVQKRAQAQEVQRSGVLLTEERTCAVCGQTFSDAIFSRHVDGGVVHCACAPAGVAERQQKEEMTSSAESSPSHRKTTSIPPPRGSKQQYNFSPSRQS